MIKLHIPNYVNESYYYKTISCIEAPIAIASGYFNHENYFYYCAYYSLYSIWKDCGFFEESNFILDKLGLELSVAASIHTKEEFFCEISDALANNHPIWLLLDYYYMFYYNFNYQNRHGSHGIIVCGIDEEKSTITIMDCVHNSFDSPFQCLTLTQDILWDIWGKSNNYFTETYNKSKVNFLIMQKNSNIITNSAYSFLKDIVESRYISKNDALINKVILNNNLDLYNFELIKRDLVDSVKSIFNLIDSIFNKIDRNTDWYKNYNELKQRYILNRAQIFSKILKGIFKGRKLEEDEKGKYIDRVQAIDDELSNFFEKFYHSELSKEYYSVFEAINHIEFIDFAPTSIMTASSELKAYDNVFNAERVINGKFNEFITDMWASNDEPSPHWIMADIGKEVSIYKITIIHDFRSPELYLIDYIIQGSNDKVKWINLVEVFGNNKSNTTHYCIGQKYRYYRIYITKPSKIDNTARMFGIECWGY